MAHHAGDVAAWANGRWYTEIVCSQGHRKLLIERISTTPSGRRTCTSERTYLKTWDYRSR